jgi:hypothetical protein
MAEVGICGGLHFLTVVLGFQEIHIQVRPILTNTTFTNFLRNLYHAVFQDFCREFEPFEGSEGPIVLQENHI